MLRYDFDWSVLWRNPYGQWMVEGILTTLHLSFFAWILGSALGLMVAVCRTSPYRPLRLAGGAYVQLFRNVPLLVQLFFWYFAIPTLLPEGMERWLNREVSDLGYYCGILCLGTYTSSRVAEVLRSGFLSVPRGMRRAALSCGLTPYQVFRHVTAGYALRVSVPLLSNEMLSCVKNSALAMTIGVLETTGMASHIDNFTFHGLETTTAASMVYLAITVVVVLVMGWVERKTIFPGMIRRQG